MAKAIFGVARGGRRFSLGFAVLTAVIAAVLAVQSGLIDLAPRARALCSPTGEPTVVTDKADYAPSETALIEGCDLGAWEGQTVTINITRPDGTVDTGAAIVSSGAFTYSYLLNGILGIYTVEVLDASSNVIAATTFTDHTSGTVLIRDNDDAFGANSYTTDAFGVTLDIGWTGTPDVTQARFLNDPTPEDACPAFVAEPWQPITEIGTTNTATFPWTVTGDTVSGLRKVCAQTAHGTLGVPDGILNHEDIIFYRRPNVALTQTCGLDVVVVMDNSGSIDASELAAEKSAINSIVAALMPETPTQMALVTFNTSASLAQPFTTSEATMTAAVNAVPTTGNFTNWDDALRDGRVLLPNRSGFSDLLIVVSDGRPNRRGGHTDLSHTPGVSGAVTETAAMGWAVAEANQAKIDGIRIVGLGIGGGLSVDNHTAISGTVTHPPTAVSVSVDAYTADFSSFASALATFAGETCPAFVNVHKAIDADGNVGTTGDQTPGANWTFNCNAAPDTCTPASGDTNASGDLTFEVDPGGDNSATVTISEPGEPGFGFVAASCTRNGNPIGTPGPGQVSGIGPLAKQDVVDCVFYNTPAAYLTVNKACVPPSDTGLFNLQIDAVTYATNAPCGGSTGPVLVTPGSHTVSETAGTGTNLSNYDVAIGGDCAPGGSVSLAAGESKTCTITNQRLGAIIIHKVAVPESPQDFDYNCTFLGPFQLDDDGANGNPLDDTETFNSVVPGAYDCTETQVPGWLMSISCNDPDGGTTVSPPTATIDLDAAETVECTFTNTFVPGQSQAVGGILGLIPGGDGAPPASRANTASSAFPYALLALALATLAGATGTLALARRRIR